MAAILSMIKPPGGVGRGVYRCGFIEAQRVADPLGRRHASYRGCLAGRGGGLGASREVAAAQNLTCPMPDIPPPNREGYYQLKHRQQQLCLWCFKFP